jgi:competence protein ComFC
MWIISSLLSTCITVLFPKKCFICEKEGFSFCEVCLQKRIQSLDTPHLFITSLFSFKDAEIQRAIHAIKYFHRKDLIEPLALQLAFIIRKKLSTHTERQYILVPIPMPRIRTYMRGYNQAELIAKTLSKQCGLKVDTSILTRARSPLRQVASKTRHSRLKNQHDSFKVSAPVINKHIVLIDDVTTTGATLNEARNILIKSGAESVEAFTIAH